MSIPATIESIPDFPGQPGQRPSPGAPTDVVPLEIGLVTAPLDRDYRNIALNSAAVDAFIAAEITAGRAHVTTVERWSPWSDLQLPLAIELATPFNYGRFTIGDRSWYAFLDAEYLNLTDSRFIVTPDVWTTYAPAIGYSIIERGHIAVAASQSDTYGANYLTAPEPISAEPVRGLLRADLLGSHPSGWTVLVVSANDLRGAASSPSPFFAAHIKADEIAGAAGLASSATITHDAIVQFDIPNAIYPWDSSGGTGDPEVAVPLVHASPVSTIDGVSAGGGVYLFTPEGFAEYMTIMQGAPWVTSGIIDVRLVPSWAVGGGGGATYGASIPSRDPSDSSWGAAAGIPNFVAEVTSSTSSPSVLAGWRDTVMADLGAGIFRKILTSPFTELLVGAGDSVRTFHPDQWQESGLSFEAVTGAAHGEASIRLLPTGYNLMGDQLGLDVATGGRAGLAHTGFGVAASNPANQDLAPYLNAYSSHQNWLSTQQNRELAITLGLEQIQLTSGAFGIVTALTGAAGGATGGALGAVTPGHAVSALSVGAGAALGSISAIGNIATAQAQANNTMTMLDISQDGSFDINAYQLGLSGEIAVETFDTWWQSLNSASGGGSPSALSSAWRAIVAQAFQAIVAVPSAERVKALLSEWRRYGYMIGQAFIPPRLDVMTHWSYWQLSEPTILGALPQGAREAVGAAFSRGVTVWQSVAEIGTEPNNQPVTGVTY